MRRLLALLLLGGTIVVLGAGAMHPMLQGTGEDQLQLIADTHAWRGIHLVLLLGTACIIIGLRVLLSRYAASPRAETIRLALPVVSLGLAVHALNIMYMTSAGTEMARLYAAGTPGVVLLYDTTHPFALMTSRFGNLLVAAGAMFIGWASWGPGPDPKWVSALAWLAGVVGLAGALIGPESSPTILLAVGLLCFWQAGVAILDLREQGIARSQ